MFRIGRAPDVWEWPDWSFAGEDGTFGNRFDDPEGEYRVLYASSERQTALRECLARFRPDPAVVAAAIEENDETAPPTLPAGNVPVSWLRNRLMGTGRLAGAFCDIGHSDSLSARCRRRRRARMPLRKVVDTQSALEAWLRSA